MVIAERAGGETLAIPLRGRPVPERIAIIAPPWIPIPPPAYGGIEQVVALQARVLEQHGYDVTLVGAPGTYVEGPECICVLDEIPAQIGEAAAEWRHLLAAQDILDEHDVVIEHSGPLGALLFGTAGRPVLHVTHGELHDDAIEIYEGTCRRAPALSLVAISDAQRRMAPSLPFAGVAHNAIETDEIPFRETPDGYLAFLGRMVPEKGAAEAIQIARRVGRPIILAAKCREPAERAYFERFVEPHLGDDVIWLGEIGPEEKFALLGGADALVFPISWPEPFGMVMIEAMACGTPVLATSRGSVPEVVRDGVTGYVRADAGELARCVAALDRIDRRACRSHVETHFGPGRLVERWQGLISATHPMPRRRPRMTLAGRPGSLPRAASRTQQDSVAEARRQHS